MKAHEKLIKIDPSSIPVLHSKRLKKNAQPRLVKLYISRDAGAARRQVLKKDFFEAREATEYIHIRRIWQK